MISQKMLTTVLAATLLLGASGAMADTPVRSDPDQRQAIELTVYTRDLALVREVRTVRMPDGEFQLEFRGVPEKIKPATLLIGGDRGLSVLEQNYEFDLMSRQSILEKYVGREVAWILEDGGRVSGRLLATAQGPVFEVDGDIMFEMPGRIVLPSLPEDLRARPTLVWRVQRDDAAEADLDVSYLTSGLSWNADYVLQLDPEGVQADLRGWVTVENRSGSGFAGATLQLVAGDIQQVRQAMRPEMVMDAMMTKSGRAPQMESESLYDYHLYTVPWATDLPNNSSKQVSMLAASGLDVERIYTVRGASHYFRGGTADDRQDVWVSYAFENREKNQLGLPLPAGVVRVYGQSGDGRQQLLGEDRIPHTPKNERVELTVGKAFDLVAERTRMDYERVADRVHRTTWRVELRNHKDEDVTVEVRESVGGDWTMTRSSHAHEKVSAQELLFRLPVAADGETTLTYTVEVRY
ncbi:DUF4139 domain-containing protein [bacterium]|nr:DUF4139 domain-containing protein [bacterium]